MTRNRIPAQRPTHGSTVPAGAAATAEQVPEPGWAEVLRVGIARAVLATLAGLLVWSVLPAAIGWTPRVILSGSMEPRVHVGDVVVTREVPQQTLAKGQVVTVVDPDHAGRTRTHRLVSRDADGLLVLQGDANRQPDSTRVPTDKVLGVGVLRIPLVGRPAAWLRDGAWLPLGATLALLGLCAVGALPRRRPQPPQDSPRGAGHSGRPMRTVAAATTAAVLASVVVAGSAEGAYKVTTANPVSTLQASTNFLAYATEVLAGSPYLYWRLDETSGNTIDDSGTGSRDGTMAGTVSRSQTGALTSETPNRAISLTTGSISTTGTAVAGPTTFSVEAWIRTSSTTGGRILGFGDKSGTTNSTMVDRQLYLAPTGKVYFGIGSAKKTLASTAALRDNVWHHVVGTFTTGPNGMKLYVDGQLQGSTNATAQSFSGYWKAGQERLTGWTGNPTDDYFDGTLDELAVYSAVLTQAQITSHYTNAAN